MHTIERICLDCSNQLKGRADKKFCDDQCRSNYNNRLKAEDSGVVKQITTILKKNRQILQKLIPENKATVKSAIVQQMGFNFTYHTHVYKTQKGNQYRFCFEYGYLELDNDMLLIIKRESI